MTTVVLLTPQDCAERCGVHVETVRRWIRDGRLPARRSATGRYRVRADDIDAFLDLDHVG